jgi:hypothetical protein
MTILIGERAYAYYRKHAPAASILLQDGDALDAGTAIDIESNISWLQYEGCRQLVASLGRGVVSYKTHGDLYLGYGDIAGARFGSSTTQSHQEIYWGGNVCARFGPFDGIADYVDSSGRVFLRPVAMDIDIFSATGADFVSTDLYYAMTASPDPAELFAGNFLAPFQKVSVGASGHKTHNDSTSIVMVPNVPAGPALTERWTCRSTGTLGSTSVAATPFYLWFGWRFINNASSACWINAMSAWEVRQGTE